MNFGKEKIHLVRFCRTFSASSIILSFLSFRRYADKLSFLDLVGLFCNSLNLVPSEIKCFNGIMCCLDVSSLFRNVPLEETLDIWLELFLHIISCHILLGSADTLKGTVRAPAADV